MQLLAECRTRAVIGCAAVMSVLMGDWREEVVWRTSDSSALRIHLTTAPTAMRLPTLMHDAQCCVAVAWQNIAYTQPPHPSFLGDGMAAPPPPDIFVPRTKDSGAGAVPGAGRTCRT